MVKAKVTPRDCCVPNLSEGDLAVPGEPHSWCCGGYEPPRANGCIHAAGKQDEVPSASKGLDP